MCVCVCVCKKITHIIKNLVFDGIRYYLNKITQ